MNDYEDYDITIEDIEIPERKQATKPQLMKIFNDRLSKSWTSQDRRGGVDIEVKPEWKKILREDGSITWDYQKLGWEVFHYQKTNNKGDVIREWLSFKHPNFKGAKE